jgi:hypothetical protein
MAQREGGGIGQWLRQPENQAALFQSGISMLQPGYGGLLANVGRGLGEGAEARDRSILNQQKRQQAELDMELDQRKIADQEKRTSLIADKPKGGGATWSSIMSNQRSQNAQFLAFLKTQAKARASEAFTDESAELAAIMDDPVQLARYRQQFQTVFGGQPDGGAIVPPGKPTANPSAPSSGTAYRENQTATNPSTGEKMIFRGGKWEPL